MFDTFADPCEVRYELFTFRADEAEIDLPEELRTYSIVTVQGKPPQPARRTNMSAQGAMHQVQGVNFSFYTEKELEALSVCQVASSSTYDQLGNCIQGVCIPLKWGLRRCGHGTAARVVLAFENAQGTSATSNFASPYGTRNYSTRCTGCSATSASTAIGSSMTEWLSRR